jgi:hypothetical protein
MAGETTRQALDPLSDTARELGEAGRILDAVEAQALTNVARMLAETAEILASTALRRSWSPTNG